MVTTASLLTPRMAALLDERAAEILDLPRAALRRVEAFTLPSAQRTDWRFAPLLHDDLEGVAPVLAECDPLVDEALAYADRLRAAGVAVTLELQRGVTHVFIKMGRALPEAKQALRAAAQALRQAWSR